MNKQRLEAFSDAVVAILMTIMVLELRAPHEADWAALQPLTPVVLSYILSFVFLAIYWNNHHHMLHATQRVSGAILWANMHLLFWLSLVPFATAWMGDTHAAPLPTATYGVVLVMAAISYTILQMTIIRHHGPESKLATAVGNDTKGKISILGYLLAIGSAFINPWISIALYVIIALVWLVPDRRIERRLTAE